MQSRLSAIVVIVFAIALKIAAIAFLTILRVMLPDSSRLSTAIAPTIPDPVTNLSIVNLTQK
ncbi:hypothetical protein H6F89_32510 [Cyanobacteria bacterium FACHB-63]|nr:hypothetical protein [Cyanobacteria bacterium FACHB-63]